MQNLSNKYKIYFSLILIAALFGIAYLSLIYNVGNLSVQSYNPAKLNGETFNSIYNTTAAYVEYVNESSYIVFYPNLHNVYINLSKAKNVSKKDPQMADSLLKSAYVESHKQLENINVYKIPALIVTVILTIITLLYLYYLTIPINKPSINKKPKVIVKHSTKKIERTRRTKVKSKVSRKRKTNKKAAKKGSQK